MKVSAQERSEPSSLKAEEVARSGDRHPVLQFFPSHFGRKYWNGLYIHLVGIQYQLSPNHTICFVLISQNAILPMQKASLKFDLLNRLGTGNCGLGGGRGSEVKQQGILEI